MYNISLITNHNFNQKNGLSIQQNYLKKQLENKNKVFINKYDKNIDIFVFYENITMNEELYKLINKIKTNKKKHKVIQINHFIWNIPELNNITDLMLQVRDKEIVHFISGYKNMKIYKYPFQINSYDKLNKNRKKDFIYVGRINEEKTSLSLFDLQEKSNIKIDFYGDVDNRFESRFQYHTYTNKNLKYKGAVQHDKINKIMQEYKYFILNSTTDIFSVQMLEQLYNGCIPFQKQRIVKGIDLFKWNDFIVNYNNAEDFIKKYNIINKNYYKFDLQKIKSSADNSYYKFENYINYILKEVFE